QSNLWERRPLGHQSVIGGSVTVVQEGTASLPCHVIDTNDDLTQITWQRRTREKPHNDNFLTILPREGPQFVNGGDARFKYIGNFNNKNGTLQLSNVTLKDEGSYTCIFTLFPSGNQKTEIPLNLLEEVLFATCTAAGSRPPAEVRWLTGVLRDKMRTTTNSTQYDNGTTTTVTILLTFYDTAYLVRNQLLLRSLKCGP
uniref:Ig-like domain-containing protein n=1 Tax=Oreochromis aureus TaxID=47969 RepID=A0A668T2I5_OREAU